MWDADIYNHYYKERSQQSVDLVHRISGKRFKRILDVGCGTGMSTAAISAVWKDSEIIGVDLSAEMLERARKDMPGITFIQRDCSKSLSDLGTFHEMNDYGEIIQFLAGTALRPYIDGLYGAEQQIFLEEVLHHIEKAYPCQLNGKVLFPFKRLFLIGTK